MLRGPVHFSGECQDSSAKYAKAGRWALSYLVRRAGLLRITYPPVLRGLIDSFGRTPFRPFSVIQSASISPDHRRLPIGMKRLGRRNRQLRTGLCNISGSVFLLDTSEY